MGETLKMGDRNFGKDTLLRIRERINGETIIGTQLTVGSVGTILSVPVGGLGAALLVLTGFLGFSLILDDMLLTSRVLKYVMLSLSNKDHNKTADE